MSINQAQLKKLDRMPIFNVDAFTNQIFSNNPAAVCLLVQWISDKILLSIAAENNLSKTAFIKQTIFTFFIRWFTPQIEVNLCGHAALPFARGLVDEFLQNEADQIIFDFKSEEINNKKAITLSTLIFLKINSHILNYQKNY